MLPITKPSHDYLQTIINALGSHMHLMTKRFLNI